MMSGMSRYLKTNSTSISLGSRSRLAFCVCRIELQRSEIAGERSMFDVDQRTISYTRETMGRGRWHLKEQDGGWGEFRGHGGVITSLSMDDQKQQRYPMETSRMKGIVSFRYFLCPRGTHKSCRFETRNRAHVR